MESTNPQKPAAFFDIDRTLMAGASALKLARPFRKEGLLSRRSQVRAAVLQLGFMFKGAGDTSIERFQAMAEKLVSGWSQADVRRIVGEEIEGSLRPMVYREALERIELHRKMNEGVYAISATLSDIAEPFALALGLDGAICSIAEVDDAGAYTGAISVYCHGAEKLARLQEFAGDNNIDLAASAAYSDSSSDVPMLRAVGRPYAVNPDRELRKIAEEEGWSILTFRDRMRAPLHARKSVRFSVAAAALAVIARILVRRHRR